jgi:hypothetical protein
MVVVVVIAGANEEAGQRDGNAGRRWPPDKAAPRSGAVVVVCRFPAVSAATPLPLIGICRLLAVITQEHCLRALRTVVDGNDTPRLDFGDAATGIYQLCAAPGISHDEVAFSGLGRARHALEPISMIDQNLSLHRVQRRR